MTKKSTFQDILYFSLEVYTTTAAFLRHRFFTPQNLSYDTPLQRMYWDRRGYYVKEISDTATTAGSTEGSVVQESTFVKSKV